GKQTRVIGHEVFGEIVEMGATVAEKYGYTVGQLVAAESHAVCNTCYQCLLGEKHVCTNEKIMGISMDGCFAEYVKLPAQILWPTDVTKIREEIAAVQEPFGNAVHAATKVDVAGQRV